MSNIVESCDLYYKKGNSDKEYHIQIVKTAAELYDVVFAYGRCGSTLNTGHKASNATLEKAELVYDKLKSEKLAKGYKEKNDTAKITKYEKSTHVEDNIEVSIPQLPNHISEEESQSYLDNNDFCAQEKMDGKHLVFYFNENHAVGYNKNGKVTSFPLVIVDDLKALNLSGDWIIDGEIIGDHYYVYDLLEKESVDIRCFKYRQRYSHLSVFLSCKNIHVVPLAISRDEKIELLASLKANKKEGIIFKRSNAKHSEGKDHADMVKYKFYETASVIVTGHNEKESIAIGLYDNDILVQVGNVTTLGHEKPPVGSIIEVRYLYAFKGGSLYQPTYLGPRDDVLKKDCTFKYQKIKFKEE